MTSGAALGPADTLAIVGASLAGLRAAEAARSDGFEGRIVLIGEELHAPYDRPPLSKAYLEDQTADTTFREHSVLVDDLGIDVRLGQRATRLDTTRKTVSTTAGTVEYERLIIATGVHARSIPGTDGLAGVHLLRTRDDATALRSELRPNVRVVVIGGGFIGSEVASSSMKLGASVTIVEAAPVPLARAVGPLGLVLTELHTSHGVAVRLGVGVESFTSDGGRISGVVLADGTELPADVLVIGIGASPATGWLRDSGLELNAFDGGVICDASLATSAPDVWAAGDVAHWHNSAFDQIMRLENWTNAAAQGAHAARNAINANDDPYSTVPYSWSDWYGHRIQFVGIPTADEVVVHSGSIEEGRMIALYRTGDRIVGALTVRQPRQIMKFRSLIENGATWNAALDLAEGAIPVAS